MLQKLICSFVLFNCFLTIGQVKISGQILDQNNLPIENAHVHVINKHAHSDVNGYYLLTDLPKGKTKVYVTNLGFISIDETLVLDNDKIHNIKMFSKVNSLNDVVVKQKRNTENNSILEQKIKLETIEKYSSQTLGDALKEVAGVSILRTGSNIVKPIINGLHSSRVPIISNNVRLEDQEWGSEHAPNFDINAAGKITVIKGASGLQYGGDAVGGLIIV